MYVWSERQEQFVKKKVVPKKFPFERLFRNIWKRICGSRIEANICLSLSYGHERLKLKTVQISRTLKKLKLFQLKFEIELLKCLSCLYTSKVPNRPFATNEIFSSSRNSKRNPQTQHAAKIGKTKDFRKCWANKWTHFAFSYEFHYCENKESGKTKWKYILVQWVCPKMVQLSVGQLKSFLDLRLSYRFAKGVTTVESRAQLGYP